MATALMSVEALLNMNYMPECASKEGAEYLASVSKFVSTHEHKCLPLKNPAGAKLKIAGLEHTIYKDEDEEVKEWGKFYLPKKVNMHIIGVVEGTSCPCNQLVLMTCENKNMYAYDGEELHLVASSMMELCVRGIKYPASDSYYNGEAFKDLTEDDWAEVRKGPVGVSLDKEHQKLVKANKSAFLASLRSSGHT